MAEFDLVPLISRFVIFFLEKFFIVCVFLLFLLFVYFPLFSKVAIMREFSNYFKIILVFKLACETRKT